MKAIEKYVEAHKDRFIAELLAFLRIPSISANKEHVPDMKKAALFLEEALLKAGCDKVDVLPTAGHPLVYAEKQVSPDLPTILVYGHYDVQPSDPDSLWKTPPFEPTIRNGNIYARGACDDKGQVYLHIKALEAMVAADALACNVKFLIEGEEEIGSPHVTSFMKDSANADLLACDVVLVSDMSMPAMDQPVIPISLRGVVMIKISIEGPNRDLHSGVYGGGVANPLHALVSLLAMLRDDHNRVTIPDFYRDVKTYTDEERAFFNQKPFDLASYQKDLGIAEVVGEQGYNTLERTSIRPTLEINGVWGGATMPKTVLPSKAYAIVSMRLVANQDHEMIVERCEAYIETLAARLPALKGTQVRVERVPGGSDAFALPTDAKAIQAVRQAFQKAWGGKPPILVGEGGSIPLLTSFQQHVSKEIAPLGFGLDDDNIHSPNEKFGVQNYLKGIQTVCAFHHAYLNRC
ncbi:MAG: dipeptidase [Cytophagales bacterium]